MINVKAFYQSTFLSFKYMKAEGGRNQGEMMTHKHSTVGRQQLWQPQSSFDTRLYNHQLQGRTSYPSGVSCLLFICKNSKTVLCQDPKVRVEI